MATTEVIRDMTPPDLAPIDTSVSIPASVRKASELANSFYKKPDEPAAPDPAAQVPDPAALAAQVPDPAAPPVVVKPEPTEDDWKHRFLSMKGRYDQSQMTIGSMQEQLTQLGDELVRTQAVMSGRTPDNRQNQPTNNHNKLITSADEETYGTELIDLARRAAQDAISPELDTLRSENRTLTAKVVETARGDLYTKLASSVPDWSTINKSPEFLAWLRLPNVYTGQVRKTMLNDAFQAADAPRVVQFFKDFIKDGVATGSRAPSDPVEPLATVPRIAATTLDALTAPGRVRPASGDTPASPADKPVFTRAQIATFYSNVRAGHYAGREAEKAQHEAQIFDAQNSGRIR